MHRQHVDDVGPVVAMSVALTEQLRGDRFTVCLVLDQNAADGVAGEWVEHLENGAKAGVRHRQGPRESPSRRVPVRPSGFGQRLGARAMQPWRGL